MKLCGLAPFTVLAFTVWHFRLPFEGTPASSVRVTSVGGALTTLGMGLVFGYIFQRTGNVIAPWLAHVLMIIGPVAVWSHEFHPVHNLETKSPKSLGVSKPTQAESTGSWAGVV